MDHNLELRKTRRALLFMQLFSTLGFSVLYSTLVLYATQGLKLSPKYALALTGGFIAFNYSLHVLGGYIGGRLMSYRGLFVIGMALQSIGCFIISFPDLYPLLIGTSIFLSGCGLNVICINCMMTQLFDSHDKRRESAFLWNYSGMNFGFFIGFSMSGYFQLHQNFHALFLFSSLGSLISFTLALLNWKHLNDKGTLYIQSKNKVDRAILTGVIILTLVGALCWLLEHANIGNILILFAGVIIALLFASFAWKEKIKEKSKKLWAFLILAISSMIFWTLYQMSPMGLTLFYVHNVHHNLFGITIPPQWTQNINTIVIVLGGPIMASINKRLRNRGFKISIPFQFTTALFLIGLGFLLLSAGIYFADAGGYSAIGWFIGYYFFQSIGELFISPIGYAMIGQLIPSKIQGLAMGAWLMVTGVAATLSNYFSQAALGTSEKTNPLITNTSYSSSFLKLALFAIIGSAILFFLRSFLHKLIQENLGLKGIEPAPYNAPQN